MTHVSFYPFRIVSPGINPVWVVMILVMLTAGCTPGRNISEGIAGKVLWFEGDLMPGIDKEPVKGKPVQRELLIYKPTTRSETTAVDQVFYSEIHTDLVKKARTDAKGNFKVKLVPGKYSLFVRESQWLYASSVSGEGYINLVEVRDKALTDIEIRIDYMAAY